MYKVKFGHFANDNYFIFCNTEAEAKEFSESVKNKGGWAKIVMGNCINE